MSKKNWVGIVGGGQLALMLAEGARQLDLHPIVLASSPDEPAYRACPGSLLLQPGNGDAVREFLGLVEVAAFENEFFPDEVREHAGEGASKFRPSLATMAILRDKFQQKQIFARLGLATAPFQELPPSADLRESVRARVESFGGHCVFKWSLGGYDGKGVFVADTSGESLARAVEFCARGFERGGVFAEQLVRFDREVALVSVRGTDGYFAAYPLVYSEQQNGVCKLVTGPASKLGVDPRLEQQAVLAAGKIAADTGLVGTFALEFFADAQGGLWINEMAPRVHNSGHFTQDVAVTSQFVNHWQAILGRSLGDTSPTAEAFAMLNLLGPDRPVASVGAFALPTPENIVFHDYQKRESRAGRKMAHLNGRVDDVAQLAWLVDSMKNIELDWQDRIVRQE